MSDDDYLVEKLTVTVVLLVIVSGIFLAISGFFE